MISDLPPAPAPALGRLNHFLKALHDADWEDPGGVIRFSGDLPLAELAAATCFQNARIFLAALAGEKGTNATATGNLNRVFVRRMFAELRLSSDFRAMTERGCKVINELDLWPLHEVRVVAELDKLVAQRRQRFQVTPRGRELLAEARAGALFRHLFITFFRQLDLRYIVYYHDVPEIQHTMAITLWRLAAVAREWRAVKGLADQILPPRVAERMRAAMVSEYHTEETILSGYVLTPLLGFGLLERRPESGWPRVEHDAAIRVTPLFWSFVHFPPEWSP